MAFKLRIGFTGLAILAAGLATYSVFQPAFDSWLAPFKEIYGGNTLLLRDTGWAILACAAGVLIATFLHWVDRQRTRFWAGAAALFGGGILACTAYQLSGNRNALEGGDPQLLELIVFRGDPGTGIHIAELAGCLAIVAGPSLAAVSLLPLSDLDV